LSDDRPIAPFGRRAVPVVAKRMLGKYTSLTVADPAGKLLRPAQFHMLMAQGNWGSSPSGRPFLPRAISYLSTDGEGSIEFLIDPVGPGTEELQALEEGDMLNIVGPLGNGFPSPTEGRRPVLVAGGIGLAPVLALAELLVSRSVAFDLVLGFRSSEHAEAAAAWPDAIITTDDGSTGVHGSVIGPLEACMLSEPSEVFACGPPGMLDAVRSLCDGAQIDSWLALESPMACGFGSCFGCAVETRDGIIRLCVDGPVVAGSSLAGVSSTGRVDPK